LPTPGHSKPVSKRAGIAGNYALNLGSQARYKICWQNVLGAAVAKVDQSALTTYYRARFNRRNATVQIAQN
jgi:hypothetical protein